jgi:hypothetical protein
MLKLSQLDISLQILTSRIVYLQGFNRTVSLVSQSLR